MFIYYSNHCNKSKELLHALYKTPLRDNFKYVNIDNRIKENGNIFILLKNGQKFHLPKEIKNVPTLLNPESKEILVGNQILNYLFPKNKNIQKKNENINNDPDSFMFNSSGSMHGVVSDSFSYFNQSESELKAEGNGGTRQLYNYVGLDNYNNNNIETPQEDDNNDKKMNMTLEELENRRMNDLNNINKNQPMKI